MSTKSRFLKYVSFDTQSEHDSNTFPSTLKQFELGKHLVNELHELGIANAYIDDYCYVYAKLESNINSDKCVGLIAHLDTATELSGKDVNPQIIAKYDGKPITLLTGQVMDVDTFPALKEVIGDELITTDGTTLLGADDKAGIAVIMHLLETLTKSDLPYPNIMICFTPDEEVGGGTDHFNYDYFKVDFAYTLDGGFVENINYENFNACSARVTINGQSIHPGSAKNKMINSMLVAHEFHAMLPAFENPAYTENYEGFNHLTVMNGSVNKTVMDYIIRNHNKELFEKQKVRFEKITAYLNDKYGDRTVNLLLQDNYYNMRELVIQKPEILSYPVMALKAHGFNPSFVPIRGGTDGARLSYNGILCPNIGNGGANFHGPYEFVSVNQMDKMCEIIITMLKLIIEDK